ncbi:UNVERIFIED_CONTAM: hypothetical protein Scaly_2849600 [Sesamum calycinum]|uniref:Gag/pol protein n=1 Tax=Sesamum calycinum TaxID=2727403 RepID=A0AAW2LKK4_9LAMI
MLASSRTMMMQNHNRDLYSSLTVVWWLGRVPSRIADSTTEVEYIAASEAAKEAVWMKNYIQELGVVPSIAEPVVIFSDNNRAIARKQRNRDLITDPNTFSNDTICLERWWEEVTFGWTESTQ